jgi:sigma-E factor negative regulatory protein RseB
MRVVERLLALSLVGLALPVGAVAPTPDPLNLLDRMTQAVRSLDYEGRFVVQSGERLDALYIVHRMSEGSEIERVVSLTGEPREIIRGDEAVACLVPGAERPINMTRRAHGHTHSPLMAMDRDELRAHYGFELSGSDRVAGREAYRIEIQPQDDLRYGYHLYVDRETALPLRTIMVDTERKPLSQLMFTEIKVGVGVTPIERDASALELAAPDPQQWSTENRLAPTSWAFEGLPPGFRLNAHRRRALPDQKDPLEHFIFSDGLATVSIYVQQARDAGALSGVARQGAASAVGRQLEGHEVVVVGEVPVKTLEWFAESIRARQ